MGNGRSGAGSVFGAGATVLCWCGMVSAGGMSNIRVDANVAGQAGNPVQIGEMVVDENQPPGNGFITADFTLAPAFAFLDAWYDFRWVNVLIGHTLNGVDVDANMDGNPDHPLVGELPAIDPAPLGFGNGDDNEPFYWTAAEFALHHAEGTSSHWEDSRSTAAVGVTVFTFRTYLVVRSITDDGQNPFTFCALSGFEWTSTIVNPGGVGSVEMQTLSIPTAGAADVMLINDALDNAERGGFPVWAAQGDCTFSACDAEPASCASVADKLQRAIDKLQRGIQKIDEILSNPGMPPAQRQMILEELLRQLASARLQIQQAIEDLIAIQDQGGTACPPGIDYQRILDKLQRGIDKLQRAIAKIEFLLQNPKLPISQVIFQLQDVRMQVQGTISQLQEALGQLGEPNPCPADLTGDNVVNAADLALLLGAWGPNPGHPADLTGNGGVDAADLAQLLGAWGPCPG